MPTLVLGSSSEPAGLDPAFVGRSAHREVLALLFRGLTRFDARGRVAPELAVALPRVEPFAGPGGHSVRVRWILQAGLRWSDGTALTSGDLVFGYRVESDPSIEVISYPVSRRVHRIESIDARTALVAWREPYADYLAPRVHAILPAHAYPRPDPGRPWLGGSSRRSRRFARRSRLPSGSGRAVLRPVVWRRRCVAS